MARIGLHLKRFIRGLIWTTALAGLIVGVILLAVHTQFWEYLLTTIVGIIVLISIYMVGHE